MGAAQSAVDPGGNDARRHSGGDAWRQRPFSQPPRRPLQTGTLHLANNINASRVTPGVEGLRFFSRGGAPLAADKEVRKEFERKS
jgi:hypothetical protein